jgi:hypothetical protein
MAKVLARPARPQVDRCRLNRGKTTQAQRRKSMDHQAPANRSARRTGGIPLTGGLTRHLRGAMQELVRTEGNDFF